MMNLNNKSYSRPRRGKLTDQQWIDIRARIISTNDSIRSIARDYGISEGSIRHHLKRRKIYRKKVRRDVRNQSVRKQLEKHANIVTDKPVVELSDQDIVSAAVEYQLQFLEDVRKLGDKLLTEVRNILDGMDDKDLIIGYKHDGTKIIGKLTLGQKAELLNRVVNVFAKSVPVMRTNLGLDEKEENAGVPVPDIIQDFGSGIVEDELKKRNERKAAAYSLPDGANIIKLAH